MIGRNRLPSPCENRPLPIRSITRAVLRCCDNLPRAVAVGFDAFDFGRGEAEQEEVFGADFLANFDVGAVQRADGQRAVHREFHVAGAGGFLAGGGNLLGQIGGRIDVMRDLDVEIGDEHHLQAAGDVVVAIDHFGHRIDQFDDQLGHVITRRGLAAEDEAARLDVDAGVAFDAVVQRDDVQQVEVLALVFVDALDLHVEQAGGVELDAKPRLDEARQVVLAFQLDRAPAAWKAASSA
jgi:hypothetical protein